MLENNAADARETAPRRAGAYRTKRRLQTIAALDQRTHAARRIAALVGMWSAQLGGKLTTAQRVAVERAAGLVALAEDARVRRLSGDLSISLQDAVRLENVASRAVAALGLPQQERANGRETGPAPMKRWSLK
jgi:hypothetical protein